MFLFSIGSLHNDLGSSMTVNGEMQLVLHRGKKFFRGRRICIVIHGCRVDIGDLLIEAALTGPNLSDFFEKVLKIVFTEERSVFHPLPVQDIAANGEKL